MSDLSRARTPHRLGVGNDDVCASTEPVAIAPVKALARNTLARLKSMTAPCGRSLVFRLGRLAVTDYALLTHWAITGRRAYERSNPDSHGRLWAADDGLLAGAQIHRRPAGCAI